MKRFFSLIIVTLTTTLAFAQAPRFNPAQMSKIRRDGSVQLARGVEGFRDGSLLESRYRAAKPAFASLSRSEDAATPANDAIHPLILNGYGFGAYYLTLVEAVNVTDEFAQLYIDFYDTDGYRKSTAILADDGRMMGEYESLSGTLPPRSMVAIATDPLETPLQYAYVTFRSVPANSFRIGVSTARIDDETFALAGGPAAPPDARRWAVRQDRTTGRLELLNANPSVATVTVRVREFDGTEVCQTSLSISPNRASTLTLPGDLKCVANASSDYLFDIDSTLPGLAVTAYEITSHGIHFNNGLQSR